MAKSVLIGKDRRVTLAELQSVALGDAVLELHAPGEEDLPPKLTEEDVSSGLSEEALSMKNRDNSDRGLLTPSATLAALTLLALSVPRLVSNKDHYDCLLLTSNLVDLVNLLKRSSKFQTVSLSKSNFLESLLHILPSNESKAIVEEHLLSKEENNNNRNDEKKKTMTMMIGESLTHLAAGALAAARGSLLARAATPIAALSAERARVSLDELSEVHFDVQRPHRGVVTTAAALRAILQGSKYVVVMNNESRGASSSTTNNNESSSSSSLSGTAVAASTIPHVHGPALEQVQSACKTLELECNCAPACLRDTTVAVLAWRQVLDAVVTLTEASLQRQQEGEADDEITTTKSTLSSSSSLMTSYPQVVETLESAVVELERALLQEAKRGCEFVRVETERAAQEARVREEAKAARAAEVSAGPSPTTKNDDDNDEFAGMSEEKRAKILEKRAKKEAKAAAKRKAKQAKTASLFGAGTLPICQVLEEATTSSDDVVVSSSLTEETVSELEGVVEKLLSGGVRRKPKIPLGTRDYLPEQMMIRQQAFSIIRRVFESHGAVEIDTPVFELKETLTGKYGEDSKLIYDLADQGGELLALRYDLTVPFARFLALNAVGNIKRFHIGKVYRRDRPVLSKGRYREFYQCDFDIAGNYGRMVPDSESLCVVCEILDALPIGDFAIKLNHRRLLDAILDICGVPADKFRTICSAVDKLDKEPWEVVKREMVEDKGLSSQVADRIGTFVLDKGEPWTMYRQLMESNKFGKHQGALEAMEDLRILFEYLEAMDKLKYMSFDLSLARGLDYYTGVIYEAVCMSGTTQVGSIGGGGRYDNLVSMFQEAGKVVPCVGVSVGIERVFTLMEARLREEQGGSIQQPNVDVLVASVGEGMMVERMKLAKILWDAKISAEYSQQENAKVKYELKDALDRGIPYMAIVGEEEVRDGTCKVKDLKARTEETVPVTELVATLRRRGVIPVGCEFAAELLSEAS